MSRPEFRKLLLQKSALGVKKVNKTILKLSKLILNAGICLGVEKSVIELKLFIKNLQILI